MKSNIFQIERSGATKTVDLSRYLTPDVEERAARESNDWIKSLRLVDVDGRPLRDAITFRGDSLWWFIELYLHKLGRTPALLRAILSLEALIDAESPSDITLVSGDALVSGVAHQVAAQRNIQYAGPTSFSAQGVERAAMELRSLTDTTLALGSRLRSQPPLPSPNHSRVAAFVHSAFWRKGGDDESGEEGYIGPVLHEVERLVGRDRLVLVGLGPATSFRARRRWRELASDRSKTTQFGIFPIQQFASWSALGESSRLWRERHALARLLSGSGLRDAARLDGIDVWPIVREDLRGAALLQLPWSARAMDEAAAALDALRPSVVVTYAEAGGWGRALILEARRRKIPSIGLQHGFIYRHWLNYRHETDEMLPSSLNPSDIGFPSPDLTLVFDDHAARHLVNIGRLPLSRVTVTGSAGLDDLAERLRAKTDQDSHHLRESLNAAPHEHIVLIASKFTQLARVLPELLNAARRIPNARIVFKPHPAETGAPYEGAAQGIENVSVAPSALGLADLLHVTRVVATVNSTVAIDAMVLGIPSLVLGLPNNLSPFVAEGVMDGVAAGGPIEPKLRRLLEDESYRRWLLQRGAEFASRFRIRADGASARRAAEAIAGFLCADRGM